MSRDEPSGRPAASPDPAALAAAESVALAPGPSDLRWRHPGESDHPRLVALVDDWYGGRKVHLAFGRFLLMHFASTSLLAETAEGKTAGYVVGFVSPDRPAEAYVQAGAVNPNLRRRGIGRQLCERFFTLARARGARNVACPVWPGDPIAVAFHRALGFEPESGPGTMRLYGTLAYPDYEYDGEDRILFRREI